MIILFYIVLAFFLLILTFHLLTRKYVSPYTFTLCFGKKGVGKSCSMQKDLRKHHKAGWHCYADSNTDLPFVKLIDAKKIYSYKFPKNSFVAIDEINLLWDNRSHKDFDPKVQKFFREQRKHGVKIFAYSQTFDCDKKLRDLCDKLALQRKCMRIWSWRRYYVKTPRIISAADARDTARAVDDLVKVPLLFGGGDLTYIPKYIKDYNTNEIHGEKLQTLPPLSPSKTSTMPPIGKLDFLKNIKGGIKGGEATTSPASAEADRKTSPAEEKDKPASG